MDQLEQNNKVTQNEIEGYRQIERYLLNNNKCSFLVIITICESSFFIDFFYQKFSFVFHLDFEKRTYHSFDELNHMILKVFDQNSELAYRFNWNYRSCELLFQEKVEDSGLWHKKFILNHLDEKQKNNGLEIVFSFQDELVRQNYLSENYQYNQVTKKVYEAEFILKEFLKQMHSLGIKSENKLFPYSAFQYVKNTFRYYSLPRQSQLVSRVSFSFFVVLFGAFLSQFSLGGGSFFAVPALIGFLGNGVKIFQKVYSKKLGPDANVSFCIDDISEVGGSYKEEPKLEKKEEVFEDYVLKDINKLLDQLENTDEEIRRKILPKAKKILADYLESLKKIAMLQDVFGHQDDYFLLRSDTVTKVAFLEEEFHQLEQEMVKEQNFNEEINRINQKIDYLDSRKNNSSLVKNMNRKKTLVLTKKLKNTDE